MIHSVMGGNHGSLHNMMNEMEAIEQLQDMYCDALIAETKLTRVKLKKMIEREYLLLEEPSAYSEISKFTLGLTVIDPVIPLEA